MAKFMFVYRNGEAPAEQPSPEDMQKAMQVWMDWIDNGTKAGWIIDGGDALTAEGRLVAPDNSVTDGPFAESKELVSGYSMVEAESFEAAVELAKNSPMISQHHGYVEIRQLAEVGKESPAV